jgi:hypothetical protein
LLRKLSEDIDLVREENAMLNSTRDILQKALSVRDDQLKILQYSKELSAIPLLSSASLTGTADDNISPALTTATTVTPPGTCTKDQIQTAGCMAAAAFASNPSSPNKSQQSCPITNLVRHEIHAINGSCSDAVQAKYTSLCTLLSNAVTDRESEHTSQRIKEKAQENLMSILSQLGILCFESARLAPTAFQKLLIAGVADKEINPDLEKWAAVQAKLGMSNEQLNQMQPPRVEFLQRAKQIAEERSEILTTMRERLEANPSKSLPISRTMENTTAVATDGGDGSSILPTFAELDAMHSASTYWLSIHEKSRALEANLMAEHLACMELVSKCFGEVLTPLQKAKAMVESYPAFPDVFAIATAAAVEQQRQNKNSSHGNLSGVGAGTATGDKLGSHLPRTDEEEASLATGDDANTMEVATSAFANALFGGRIVFKNNE